MAGDSSRTGDFLLGLGDFAVSYGLSLTILNMIWFLLFTAQMLIITAQGKKDPGISMKAVGCRSKRWKDTNSMIYNAQYNYVYAVLLLA